MCAQGRRRAFLSCWRSSPASSARRWIRASSRRVLERSGPATEIAVKLECCSIGNPAGASKKRWTLPLPDSSTPWPDEYTKRWRIHISCMRKCRASHYAYYAVGPRVVHVLVVFLAGFLALLARPPEAESARAASPIKGLASCMAPPGRSNIFPVTLREWRDRYEAMTMVVARGK